MAREIELTEEATSSLCHQLTKYWEVPLIDEVLLIQCWFTGFKVWFITEEGITDYETVKMTIHKTCVEDVLVIR